MDKEQLEVNIAALELLVNETTDKSKDFAAQLEQAKKDLADINKPVLTGLQLDDIQEAIEAGIESFDFSDNDNYSIEYGIDYDGKVHCENLELTDTYELTEEITKKVHRLFKEILDTTEADNHPVEKLQN
jgi:hypothetical protein